MAASAPDIYVQIPAYRDAELAPTLLSLYRQAARPERLRVRVLWQRGDDDTLPKSVLGLPNLELDIVAASRSQGCNWARRQLQEAWRGERYTIVLDSHHRFVRGWDRLSLTMLEQVRSGGARKPLLTAYLPNYVPAREPAGRKQRPFKIYPYARERGVLIRLTSAPVRGWTGLTGPVPADFLSLHYIVADGQFNTDIVMDPAIYFFGDEVLTSLRAFTAGYRLAHPHRVVGWHAYDRSERVPHWAEHRDWDERHQRSLATLRQTFLGTGSARDARAVADYERHINLALVLP